MARRVLAPLLLATLLAAPFASAATVTLPRWQVGDEWTYAITLVENGATLQTGERHVVVTARGPFDFHGTSREAVTLTTWQNMTGDPSAQWEDVRDARTGALLATRSGGQTLVAVEPCEDLRFPLENGMTWTDACDLGSGSVETTYQVVGGETLALPAGEFEALTVDHFNGGSGRMWFAEEACGKAAEFSQTNALATYVNLTHVRCTTSVATPATPTPPTGTTTPPATTTTTVTGATTTPTVSTITTTLTGQATTPTGAGNRTAASPETPGPGLAIILAAAAAGVLLARRSKRS